MTGALAAAQQAIPGAPAPRPSPAQTAPPGAAANPAGPLAPVPIPPSLASCSDPICFAGGEAKFDAQHSELLVPDFEAVDTTRGLMYVRADQLSATGLGQGKTLTIGHSRWMLTGHVLAEMSQGEVQADSAMVQLVDNSIASILAQGHPARFVHRPSATAPPAGGNALLGANQTVYGHAEQITYDVEHGQVQLVGDSWLSDGCNEFTSQRIRYDTRTGNVQAGAAPGSGARVHGTLRSTRPGTSCPSPTPP